MSELIEEGEKPFSSSTKIRRSVGLGKKSVEQKRKPVDQGRKSLDQKPLLSSRLKLRVP